MSKQYVIYQEGVYRVAGSRVSLDSIVYAFCNGQTAESISQSFPVITLEQVYGTITFYLANRSEIDNYLKDADTNFDVMRQSSRDSDPMFYQKLADTRRHSEVSGI